MSYPLAFHPQVKRHLQATPQNWHPRLKGALITLAKNPVAHSSVLKGKWEDMLVYDAPPYQIVYRLFDREQVILVTAITTVK